MVSNLVMAKVPAAKTMVALMVLSINLSISSFSLFPTPSRTEPEEENPAPSKESLPSWLAPNPLTNSVSKPLPSLSTLLTTTPSCWSVLSVLCTGITSSSSTMEFTITTKLDFFVFCLFLQKSGLVWENFEMGLDLGFSFDRGSKLWGDMVGMDAMADTELRWEELSWVLTLFLSE